MYRILFTKQADRALRRMPLGSAKLIREKIDRIAEDPYARHGNTIKLKNRPGCRLRVGKWRVIYEIKQEEVVILVLKIAARGEIYR